LFFAAMYEEMGSILQNMFMQTESFSYCSSIKVFFKDIKLTNSRCYCLLLQQTKNIP